jgi:S-formylglutathione hydrolase FrmB
MAHYTHGPIPRAGGRSATVRRVPLRQLEGLAGPPWEPPLQGTLDRLVVESEVLAGNPLGDPTRRPLYVYVSAGAQDTRLCTVYVIQGYSGRADMWLERPAFEPSMIDRLETMFSDERCPRGIVVFVDAWTALGGSQFLNSPAIGPYMDYLCDEVVPFVDEHYPTHGDRDHRALAGKSSGGYGAMVVPMLRPDTFGALASHAGDALFEACYLRDFPVIARQLRDHFDGSLDEFLGQVAAADHFDWSRFGAAFSLYAYAAAYSSKAGEVELPFEIETGRVIDDVWARWLEHDPVRMAPRYADALRSMRRIYLDAGKRDEWFLDLGAQAFSNELSKLEVEHTLELFDGAHGGISHRYPRAIRELLSALTD